MISVEKTETEAPAMAAPMSTPYWTNYSNTAARVILWPDAVGAMPAEIGALGCSKLMVLCGPTTRRSALFRRVTGVLGDMVAAVADDVAQHTPSIQVMRNATTARSADVDGFVAIGGGSSSDMAKAVSIVLAEGGDISEHASRFVPPDQFYPKELYRQSSRSSRYPPPPRRRKSHRDWASGARTGARCCSGTSSWLPG